MTPAGWGVAAAYALGLALLVWRGFRRAGLTRFGAANLVTLSRAVLVGGVAVLITVDGPMPVLVVISAVALALDGVDGRVARRTGTVTPFGARFDLEVDAVLILLLSLAVAQSLGAWVLLIGAARYLLLAAQRLWPWLRRPTPPRYWRKVVAAIQGGVLILVLTDLLPAGVELIMVAVALALLAWSFGTEAWWLARHQVDVVSAPARASVAVVAGLVTWLALACPDQPAAFTPAGFARLPVELLAILLVAVLLPRRVGLIMAGPAGVAVGGLLVFKVINLGYSAVLDRTFDPRSGPGELASAVGMLRDSVGPIAAQAVAAGAVVVLIALVGGVTWAVRYLVRFVAEHRARAGVPVAAGALGYVMLAGVGVQLAGVPVASTAATVLAAGPVDRLPDAADPFAAVEPDHLLNRLRGRDVLIIFIESYGRVAVQDSDFASAVNNTLDAGTATLGSIGYSAQSGFLTSTTYGGLSWLAHSSLQSGLPVDSQPRYRQLLDSSRLTLARAFGRAGWRTVAAIPADTTDWPEGRAFYGWQQLYDQTNVDYAGPSFSYAARPDQFTLKSFADRELGPGHAPVMAEIDLVSSHGPWSPLPDLVPWDQIGDGSIYAPMAAAGPAPDVLWRDPAAGRAAYGRSISYSIDSVISLLQNVDDDQLTVIMLGDHQPSSVVSGSDSGRDVPISIISKDPAVLARIADWGWTPGLRPEPDAPTEPMPAFRDRFLTAYS